MAAGEKKKILILGGGFGGLYTALELEGLAARGDVEVTVVNRENFILFTPMLHEVAASDVELAHIVNPIRKMLRHVHFMEGEVTSIDLSARRVVVEHGSQERHSHDLTYDHLVLALGAVTNCYNLPGVQEDSVYMKSLGDAMHLRNRLIQQLEEADFDCSPDVRKTLLTFVVAGGGFAGVETIAGINDFVRESVRFYPNLKEEDVRVIAVQPGDYLLPELGEKLGRYTQKKLIERKVEVFSNTRVCSYVDGMVVLSEGTKIRTNILVWTAGTSVNPLIASLPADRERGRIKVNEFMEVPQWPGVWALGDCCYMVDPTNGQPYPPTAQHAIRQGPVLAHNITVSIRGGQKKPFLFKTLGMLAAIGRRVGVAQVMGMNFSGFGAWLMWRAIYLSKLPRFEKKVRVLLDWMLDLVFTKDLVQFLSHRHASISHDEDGEAGVPATTTALK